MRSIFFLLMPVVLVGACGGSSSSSISDPAAADGGGGTGADGGGSSATYTLDNVCDLTAPKICALRKSCCEKSFGYDEAACLANAKADCTKDVADARGGRMTFHPELVDECLTKFKPILDGCFATIDLLLKAFDIAECRIFVGQLDEGAQCERDSQCKSGPAGAFVDCDDDKKTCKYTRLLKSGDACSYGDNSNGFCDKGLYCDAPLVGGVGGTCKTATPIGAQCNSLALVTAECGLGAYCDKGTGKCTAAKEAGASCETGFECQAPECESSGGGGGKKCARPAPIVHSNECK